MYSRMLIFSILLSYDYYVNLNFPFCLFKKAEFLCLPILRICPIPTGLSPTRMKLLVLKQNMCQSPLIDRDRTFPRFRGIIQLLWLPYSHFIPILIGIEDNIVESDQFIRSIYINMFSICIKFNRLIRV